MTNRFRVRVGPKGQVVIAKELRRKYGIKERTLVEQRSTDRGILLIPISTDALLKELDSIAEAVGKAWPRGLSAVEAVREDRERDEQGGA